MTELDQQTKQWLKSLKINKTLTSLADFENGYNFGTIFDKLQLSKGKKFKNSSDLACVFQNYKNVRDILLECFNYDFPVNNIIYRTADLLKVVRQQGNKYLQQKKMLTLKAATSIGSFDKSLIQPQQQKQFKTREKQINSSSTLFHQTSKLPKKIQDIEKKLDKFRQQKTRHELVALEERKQQIQQYRRVVMNNRDYEINKTRKNHEQGKQKQRKVYDVWYKTELIKKSRIETDKNFDLFQQEKRNKFLDSIRKDDVDTINKGMEMFQLNCMRQGIQLQHDPDKPLKPEGQFNKIVVLERIKDNIQKHQIDKKQRIKRENKKKLDAQQAKIQSQALWGELNKIDDLGKKLSSHFSLCETTYKVQKRLEGEYETRKQKCKYKTFVDLPAYEDEQKRQSQFRKRKVEYLFNDVKYVENKWNKQFQISEQIVEALLQVAIEGQEKFNKNGGFLYSQWKQIEERFLNFQDSRKNKSKDTKLYVDYSNFNKLFSQYLKADGSWRNFHSFEPQNLQSQLLKYVMSAIISKSYPDLSLPLKEKLPLDLPLKVIFHGAKLSGKSSHSAKLAEKYGVVIINPKEIIKESLQLAKPPVQQDNKKGAKKESKKVEQLTSEKIALKQFGAKLSQKINSVDEASISQYIQAIKFKLLQNFKVKSEQQIIAQYTSAKEKQKSRHEQALKDFEEAQKKPKKDSKKGGQQAIEDPPKPNTCFYSLGFVIDEFPLSEQNLRILQRQVNGFISDEEKINIEGVKTKKMISSVLSIPQPPKDDRLKPGTFDLLFCLQVDEQNALKRKNGRKIDPQTKIIYHPTFNPIPQVKGFAEKLVELPGLDEETIKSSLTKFEGQKQKILKFYSVFGFDQGKVSANAKIFEKDQGVNQTFEQISNKIQNLLQEKYMKIQALVANGGADSTQNLNTQNKSIDQNQNQGETFEKFLDHNLNQQQSRQIIEKYVSDVKKYEQEVKEALFELDKQREVFLRELLTVQKNFTNIINRPDDKAGKILAFQQNYNKLLQEKGNIVKDAEASKHLIHRLNQLYDSLWSAIESKKNESVQSRIQFKQSDWLNIQCKRIVEIGKNLLQAELNYLCETIFTILILSCKLQKKSSDYLTQYLALGIASQFEPIETISQNPNNLLQNRRIEYYINQTNKCLQSLPGWIQQKYKKMKIEKLPGIDQLLSQFVNLGVENIRRRQSNIRNKCNQRILEERSYYQVLLNKMDDWVIQGIKAENDFVYQIYKNIKKSIEEVKKSNVKELHAKQITQLLYPIRDLTLNSIPLRLQTIYNKIPIYSYMIFLEQIKTLTNNEGKINFQIFKKYMDKRRKSQLLHPIILRINYDSVEQYLVKDGYLYLKQLALAVILWHINVFDDDQLSTYKSKLLKQEITSQQKSYRAMASNSQSEENSPEKSISLNSSGKKRGSAISAFPTQKRIKFDELILMQGAFDQQEQLIFKHFIFEIFRQNGSDYIQAQNYLDTLSLFDQIQVLKYGNTVMILDI